MRLPRAGELVIYQIETETFAMIGASRVMLWKGTSVGQIVRAARSMAWRDAQTPVFEIEVEGGEVCNIVLGRIIASGQPWIWSRV